MPLMQDSFIDIAALDPVRGRFAAGEALAVLSIGLDRVIWANGAGAALFGFSDVAAIVGAEAQIGLSAKRQIMATSGYPRIGEERAITVRLASGLMSRAVPFSASELALPGGEAAILLAHAGPATSWRSPADIAGRAIAGLNLPDRHVAIVDAAGQPLAASRDFATLEVKPEALLSLGAATNGERLMRGTVGTARGACAVALLRLADDVAFVEVMDEVLPQSAPDAVAESEAVAQADAPAIEQAEIGAGHASEQPVTAGEPAVDAPALSSEAPPIPAGPEPTAAEQEPAAATEDELAAQSPAEDLPVEGSQLLAAGEVAQEALTSQVEAEAPPPRDAAEARDTATETAAAGLAADE